MKNQLVIQLVAFLFVASIVSSALAQEDAGTQTTSGDWIKVKPTGARALVEMPVKPRYIERPFTPVKNKPPIVVKLHLGTINEGQTSFVFSYHDLHERPSSPKEVDDTLEGAVRGSVANVLGQLVAEPTKIKFKETLGRQFIYRCQQQDRLFVVTSRVFLKDQRLYQVSCIMDDSIFDELIAGKFLNSFRYVEMVFDLPPRPSIQR